MRMDSITFDQYFAEKRELINNHIADTIPTENVPAILRDAINYSLLAGGKRIRPILTIACYEAFGLDSDPIVLSACSVEMLHTYSLIHDDLPIMDNDDMRRGKPTNHKVYGDGIALLAGDALLTHAFGNLAKELSRLETVSRPRALQIIEEFAHYTGAAGMVGGQVVDFKGESDLTGLAQVIYIHEHKTADLVIFAVRLGAILAGADERQMGALTNFAKKIGIAFQIQDDILDIVGDPTKMGKTTGSDAANEKLTYPFYKGVKQSQQDVIQLINEAKKEIQMIDIDPRRLEEIADLLIIRDY